MQSMEAIRITTPPLTNPFTHKCDLLLISPYIITLESNVKVMKIMEIDCQTNSPRHYHRKCKYKEISVENTNIHFWDVKG